MFNGSTSSMNNSTSSMNSTSSSSSSSFTTSHQTYIYSLDTSTMAATSAAAVSTFNALVSTSSGADSTWMTSTELSWTTDDNATNQSYVTLIPPDPYWDRIPFAHKYWRQFDIKNIPAGYHYAIAIWMTFFGILGTLGNLLVIWVFCSTKSLRTPPNMLVINLAFSDMTFSAVNGFPLLTISSINRIWTWGEICCKFYGFVGGIMGLMSINTLAIVAIDRYYVIAKPMSAAQTMTKKRTSFMILLIWTWSALWSAPPLFGWGNYIPEGLQTECTFDYLTQDINNISFVSCMYIASFVLPVTMIVISYRGIVAAVFAHHRELQATAQRMGAKMTTDDQEKKSEIQTAKVSAMAVGSFLLSWTPYAVIALLGMVLPHEWMVVTPYMSMVPVMFAKASAAYNPIIYSISHPKFRAEIDRRLPWLLCCCRPKKRFIDRSSTSRGDNSRMSQASTISRVETETYVEMTPTVSADQVTVAAVSGNQTSSTPAAPDATQCS